MRIERFFHSLPPAGPGLLVLIAGLAPAVAPPGAAAQGLSGFAQIQYQETQSGSDQRRSWIQAYELDHAATLGEQVHILSQLQLNRSSFLERPEATTFPRASFRFVHPVLGFFFTRQPNSSTDALGLVTRQQETLVTSYFQHAGLPHVEVSWIRRHRDPNTSLREEASVSRMLQASQDLGPLGLRMGYSDINEEASRTFGGRFQRTYDGGATLRFTPVKALPLFLQTSFSDSRRGEDQRNPPWTRSYDLLANSGYRFSPSFDWSFSYAFHRTHDLTVPAVQLPLQDNHEGTLSLNYHPTRATRLTVGSGVRTVRTDLRQNVIGYLAFSASADGQVRQGWRGTAETAHALNGNPGQPKSWVDTYRAGSSFTLARGLEFTSDAQTTFNGDSSASAASTISQVSAGLRAAPLRGFTLIYSVRYYNTGPSVFTIVARSRASSMDVQWRPMAALSMGFNSSITRALPDALQKLSTTQVNLDWKPSDHFQANGHLSRTRGGTNTVLGGQLTGSEVRGVRILAGLGRSLRASATYSVADPGTASRGSVLNLSITRSFGR